MSTSSNTNNELIIIEGLQEECSNDIHEETRENKTISMEESQEPAKQERQVEIKEDVEQFIVLVELQF